jgi:hypothetical protein
LNLLYARCTPAGLSIGGRSGTTPPEAVLPPSQILVKSKGVVVRPNSTGSGTFGWGSTVPLAHAEVK